MSDLAKAVEECLVISGVIRLKPYEKIDWKCLMPLVLWDSIRSNQHQVTVFNDNYWYSQGNKLSITFNGIEGEFQYQLKAMTLGMCTQGSSEGMDPLSWVTIRRIIATLKRLAKWFKQYKINSTRQAQPKRALC